MIGRCLLHARCWLEFMCVLKVRTTLEVGVVGPISQMKTERLRGEVTSPMTLPEDKGVLGSYPLFTSFQAWGQFGVAAG